MTQGLGPRSPQYQLDSEVPKKPDGEPESQGRVDVERQDQGPGVQSRAPLSSPAR